MAYVTYYRVQFKNELNQIVIVNYQKKDGVIGTTVVDYAAREVTIRRAAPEEGRFACIIGSELTATFDMRVTDLDYWNEFVNAANDTWKCVATVDGRSVFHGFVLPDEGYVPFQDKPYDATIKATDGLALLKQKDFSKYLGTNFNASHTWIEYIAGALAKTNLDLNIRVYDNVYHDSMFRRDSGLQYDCVGQAKLEYRTFQKTATESVDCYTALEIILKKGYQLCYWDGEWVIKRLGMFQYQPFATEYYTVYSANSTAATGFVEDETHAEVGKTKIIYPHGMDQTKSVKFTAKSVKTSFLYKVWDEIPKNNKFERGTFVAPPSSATQLYYTIDDWTHTRVVMDPLPTFSAATGSAYRRTTLNAYGFETDREIIISVAPGTIKWLLSEGIPVKTGDKITFGAQFRNETNFAPGFYVVARIYLITDDGTPLKWGLDTEGFWVSNSYGTITLVYSGSQNTTEYKSVNVQSEGIPEDGTLYIALETEGATPGANVYFKDIQFTYTQYIAGSLTSVKGDYCKRTQSATYLDKIEDEIHVSDSLRKTLKGAILLGVSAYLSTPEWYRYGLSEQWSYKDLINIAIYNYYFRRFWQIEGSFTGTTYSAANEPLIYQPIAFHKKYKFSDIQTVYGEERFFQLVPPLTIDLIRGWTTAIWAECSLTGNGDGQETGDTTEQKFIF